MFVGIVGQIYLRKIVWLLAVLRHVVHAALAPVVHVVDNGYKELEYRGDLRLRWSLAPDFKSGILAKGIRFDSVRTPP